MKKYIASDLYGAKIECVDVDRETEKSVWINGRVKAKRSTYENYFDTWEQAKTFLMDEAKLKVESVRYSLQIANSDLGNIKGMKEPKT